MEQPPIEVFGVKILEPVTSATDLLVAAVCFFAYYQLSRQDRQAKSLRYMRYYFLTLGIATTVAAFMAHAFLYVLGPAWKFPGWILSMISISWLERSSIAHSSPLMNKGSAHTVSKANYLELFVLIGLTIITAKFIFVEIHSAFGLLIVATPLHYLAWKKEKDLGSKYILFAVGFAAVAAAFFASKWGFSKWFNHSDIAHVFLAISAYFTYLGACNMNVYTRQKKKIYVEEAVEEYV